MTLLPHPTNPITRDNVDSLLDSGLIYGAMKSGRWWRIRRNGATKRWKRDAARIAVPFKAGMYTYGKIDEGDFMQDGTLRTDYFRHRDDVPVAVRA